MRRRIDVEPDDVAQLVHELRIVGELELTHPVRLKAMGAPDALHRADTDAGLGHRRAGPVRRLARRLSRVARRRARPSGSSGGMREGRVLSRSSPRALAAKRSCQRQTHVLDLPVWRMISSVPRPSAVSSTIWARQTCFCGALRSLPKSLSRHAGRGHRDGYSRSHRRRLACGKPLGIPNGIQMSERIH